MPDPTAPAAPRSIPGPSTRPETPPVNAPIANAARGNVPGAQARSDRRASARADLAKVGAGMKDGTITNTSVPATPSTTNQPAARPANAPAPQPNPSTAAPKPGAPAQGTPQTPEQKQASAERATKLANARRVLARDGYEPDEIAALEKNEEKFFAKATDRQRHQAEVDRIMTEHAQLKRAAPQPRSDSGQFAPKTVDAPAAGNATPPAASDPAAAAAVVQGNAPAIAQDPEIAQILQAAEAQLGKPATQLLGKITDILASRVGARAQTAEMLVRQQLLTQGQTQFQADYPEQYTENPDAFTEVQANFGALLASGRYQDSQIQKAWSDALHMQFGPPNTVQNSQRAMLARQSAAAAGNVDVGESRAPTAQANQPSRMDLLKRAGELMKNGTGQTIDQLRQALHS